MRFSLQLSLKTNLACRFAGLISTDRFTSVTFVDSEIGDGIFFDNLSYGHAVPEPSTLILVLTALGSWACLAG